MKSYPCPDLSNAAIADISGSLNGDSTQTVSSDGGGGADLDFPIETNNTIIDKSSVKKVKSEPKAAPADPLDNYKDVKIKDSNGLIKKKEPKKIHRVGKKNILERTIYAGKHRRKK